ncbi:MAG TPA: hypothetical protein DHW42_06710 [Candidatus Marinimicrobia bacterium]|nr:hypothetical protein [Candidatus Neomarinimicrobiota bacterium]
MVIVKHSYGFVFYPGGISGSNLRAKSMMLSKTGHSSIKCVFAGNLTEIFLAPNILVVLMKVRPKFPPVSSLAPLVIDNNLLVFHLSIVSLRHVESKVTIIRGAKLILF